MTWRRTGEKTLPVLVALILVLALSSLPASVRGAEESAGGDPQKAETVTGPMNFDAAARLALRQSPYFTKSSLSVELKRYDETDSKFDLIPHISFRTHYYVSQPNSNSNQPYSLQFTSNNYNPVESYLTLQAQKLLTRIAVLAHMKVISQGLEKLGKMFLEFDALKQTEARQDELVDLSRQNLEYYQNRLRLGTATNLEIRVATGELDAARAEKERIAHSQKRLRERLKGFIGLKPSQVLELDLKDVRGQVKGAFDPAGASLAQVRNNSYELKIAELKKQLQSYNIMLAKAKLLPNFFIGMQTPDPLSGVTSRDLYFSVGLEMPVWDGFKRLRNISRQKTLLRQIHLEIDSKEVDLADKWDLAQEDLQATVVSRKSAQAQEELARLQERQAEIRYHSGSAPLNVYLEGRKSLLDAERNTYLRNLDYDLAVLGLRRLTGDLGATYVDANSWQ